MKKIFLLLLITATTCCITNAQGSRNSIFVEFAGPGLASVNFDYRLNKFEPSGLGFRAGIGGFRISDGAGNSYTLTTVPLGVNYLLGKDGKHFFELGAGTTIVSINGKNTSGNDVFKGSFGHLNLGYRLQPRNGGFNFRAAVNPLFGSGTFFPFYGGISFGYSF